MELHDIVHVLGILPSEEELCHVPADHEWYGVSEPQTQSQVATNSLERCLPLRLWNRVYSQAYTYVWCTCSACNHLRHIYLCHTKPNTWHCIHSKKHSLSTLKVHVYGMYMYNSLWSQSSFLGLTIRNNKAVCILWGMHVHVHNENTAVTQT